MSTSTPPPLPSQKVGINRLEYFGVIIGLALLQGFIAVMANIFLPKEYAHLLTNFFLFTNTVAIIVAGIFRCRNMECSPYWLLLCFAPIINPLPPISLISSGLSALLLFAPQGYGTKHKKGILVWLIAIPLTLGTLYSISNGALNTLNQMKAEAKMSGESALMEIIQTAKLRYSLVHPEDAGKPATFEQLQPYIMINKQPVKDKEAFEKTLEVFSGKTIENYGTFPDQNRNTTPPKLK